MSSARVVGILIAPEEGGPVERRDSVRAVAGSGLEGDHYFVSLDAPRSGSDPSEEITLIAIEGIEAAARESGLDLTPEDARRNIVTSGIELGPLIGHTFTVGDVEVEALEDNPPCRHLQDMAGKKLVKPLMGRAGIRGRIVRSGEIRVGDEIALSGANPSLQA
jgi:MOSC domain-containing protein YiiM